MFKAIIGDDEKNICILLRKLVNWEQLGIRLIGEYYNGNDLLEAIRRDQPDIVVTDILMPGMNGLDIVKNCIAEEMETVFLLISGHAEFEYVHMAIQYGVENYLLKPINQQELEKNLKQICMRLNEKIVTQQNNLELIQQLHVSREIISQQFLNNFLFSPEFIERKEISELNEKYHLNFQEGGYRLIAIRPDFKMKYSSEQYRQVLRQIFKFVMENMEGAYYQVLGLYTSYEVILLINYRDEKEAAINIRQNMKAVQNHFYYYCEITFGISSRAGNLFDVSLDEAMYAVLCRNMIGRGKIIDYSGLSYFTLKIPKAAHMEKFRSSLEVQNKKGLEELFRQLHEWCSKPNLNPGSLYSLLSEMGKLLTSVIDEEFPAWEQRDRDYLLALNCATSLDMMVKVMEDLVKRYLEERQNSELAKEIKHVAIAKEYVLNHLEENITLNDISEIVFMNPTYFSTLFKKETGQNFSDYMLEQKIARAKELLKDLSLTVGEVGARVGYQNPRYFSKVFLKSVGIKPSEYRRLYM